jgi:NTE family protein
MSDNKTTTQLQSGGKSVSLVLGSGGARGLAHIGVIRCLRERGYDIRSISGCSMGALIGGIYGAGKLDEFEQWVSEITKLDIVALLDFSIQQGGFVKGDKIINTLKDLVGDCLIEDLSISFTAVAVDLTREKEVWFTSGSLFNAIRASISLPLFFTPFTYKGRKLIDGGVLNPVPIAPTFGDQTDITIAVNLNGEDEDLTHLDMSRKSTEEKSQSIKKRISEFIEGLTQSRQIDEKEDFTFYTVASRAFDVMQSTITRHKLATYPPDLTIEIPHNVCEVLDFDQAKKAIEVGYIKACAAMDNLCHDTDD